MKTKFTATMTFPEDKNNVITLRNEFDLTEKEAMNLIIRTALEHRETFEKMVDELKTRQTELKNEKKREKLEQQIAKLKSKK